MMPDRLSRYGQATLALWARGHAVLKQHPARGFLGDVALHALVGVLRSCATPTELFERYEVAAASDFCLIASVMHGYPPGLGYWHVRDAAFYLRWGELTGGSG